MLQQIIERVYEKVTGTPYYTTRTASAEFGPCPAAVHKERLAALSDDQAHALWEELKAAHYAAKALKRDGTWPAGWTVERFAAAGRSENRVREWLHARTKVGAAR